MKELICKILEGLRWVSVAVLLYVGYYYFDVIHLYFPLIACLTVFIFGGSLGSESTFLSTKESSVTGYKASPYKMQCGFFFFALAVAALLSYFLKWGVLSQTSILIVLLLFLSASAVNHLVFAMQEKKNVIGNVILRFVGTIMMVSFYIPLIVKAVSKVSAF